jgi:hypothetical protein
MTRPITPEMQLLELLRSSDEPTASDRDRVRANIALKLAAGATVATTLVAAQHGSWLLRGGTLAAWLKGTTLASVVIGAGLATTMYFAPGNPPPTAELSPAVQTRAVTSPDKTIPTKPEATPETETNDEPLTDDAEASPDTKRVVNPIKSQARGSTLEDELKLITIAQKALKAGQPDEAQRALDEHQRRFPAGALAIERVGIRTVALCQSGRLDEGRRAARNYLRKVPNSVLSKRIRVACRMMDE